MFCPKCGSKMNDDAKFCSSCGWKVDGGNIVTKTMNTKFLIPIILGIVVIVVVLFNVLIGGKNHILNNNWLKNCPVDASKIEVINFQEGGNKPSGTEWKIGSNGLKCYATEKEIVVHIPKEHKLYAPKDSSYLFSLKKVDAEKKAVGEEDSIKEIKNLSLLDTSKVTNMKGMFLSCYHITNIDVSNFNTSNVTDMSHMFRGCVSLNNIDVSKWDTSKVTDMNCMFSNCLELTTLDVSNWDTSKVTDMSNMFHMIGKDIDGDGVFTEHDSLVDQALLGNVYVKLTKLDVSNWDTSKVKNMERMFMWCLALKELDVSNWDTSKVTNMCAMFSNCFELTTLDVSNWDTSNIENMDGMDLDSYIGYN